MDKSMRTLLNPERIDLTEEQEIVVSCFEEVDQEMKMLDDLADRLDAIVDTTMTA